MAQNVTVAGASYTDVPAVSLPKTGGGTATFYDQDSLTDVFAAKDHTHGNITNAGALQTSDITIASGDKLVVTDSSNSSKIARTSVSFDGSTTTTALTPKGTWETFLKTAPVTSVNGSTGAVTLTIPTITKTTATLSSSSWNSTSHTQSVTVSGVTTSNTVIVSPAPSDISTWVAGGVRCTAQAANSLTFTADTNPSANITVNVVIL
jgi:hypothetical protein